MRIRLQSYWRLLSRYLRPLRPKVLLLAAVLLGSIGLQLYKRFIDEAQAGTAGFRLILLAALFLGLALDLSFHKERTPGEMIERIDGDVTALANFFSAFVVQVAGNALLLAGVLAVLFTVDWRAGRPVLFSATLKENILLGVPEGRADLDGAVCAAVLEQDVQTLERQLETQVGARGVKLSGGQVQRTAAARMFVRDPELLVFDDLSSALDEETERQLWERLRARKSTTCLAVSHRPAVLEAADQILLMRDGRIEAVGTAQQLLAASAEFRAIWAGAAT